jgi:hypothetical protein
MEKAYAEMHGGYTSNSFTHGESGAYAMQTITGQPSQGWLVAPNPEKLGMNQAQSAGTISTVDQLAALLSCNLRARHAMTAGTLPPCYPDQAAPGIWERFLSYFSDQANTPARTAPAWVDKQGNPTKDFRCTGASDAFFQDGGGPLVRGHAYFVMKCEKGKVVMGNPYGGVIELTHQQFLHAFRQIHVNNTPATKGCSCG